MPWSTPTLSEVRSLVRDQIHGSLPGSDATVPNSVLRVMSDAQGALCFLTLEYQDWLALQLMPDTAETTWLDRFGNIWLVNADGTTGRKMATLASGTAEATGQPGAIIPQGTLLGAAVGTVAAGGAVTYQVTQQAVLGAGPTPISLQALDAGQIGNLFPQSTLSFAQPPVGVNNTVTVVSMDGGNDPETDDQLRARILLRIREPPMGGDADDYVQWTLSIPGVTRAWSYPLEMGIGTVTVRFMMDQLRADQGGFPTLQDVANVQAYLDTVRPVAVKDFFVEAPIPYPIDLLIENLNSDDPTTRQNITNSLQNEFLLNSQPGQTWFRAWTDLGILNAVGVISYFLVNATDTVMPNNGSMPVLGDIQYVAAPPSP